MAKEKTESAKTAGADKTPETKKPKEVTVKVGDTEFTGLCTSKRKIPGGGSQVFLQLKGDVSRWFNAEDVVK